MTRDAVESLADALDQLGRGETRTRPVSISLPQPLADALQQLADAGVVASTSAAATEALTQWGYNRLLRLTLDELYERDPRLRPAPERVGEMASRLGVKLPVRPPKTG